MLNIDDYLETQLMIYEISWLFDWLKCTLILLIEMYIDIYFIHWIWFVIIIKCSTCKKKVHYMITPLKFE